ncbi:hypothetical protein FIC_00685 [Flavobacteriaceae bacterium 3519-10]|nr:hypothetical protein FIC_00685 [Flavobacteriaceae bacterium 3519-10]
MKNILKISFIVLVATLLFSCRNNDDIPQDIHEHEEIEKLVVTVANVNTPADKQTVNYIGGVADGKFFLLAGETYSVALDFQVRHDDHYHSVNDEIIEERDEHFVTYEFAGSDIAVRRAADDVVRTDGNKIGLRTEWTVNSVTGQGNAAIKLVHGSTSVQQNFPSELNQQGKTTGGETDVNANIGIN